jgi:hypothetical protein
MATFVYKKTDLFGNDEMVIATKKNVKPDLFTNHDAFVEKFEAKKTTDDCYTPKAVYDCVLAYVRRNCDIEGCEIVRPFFPDGDYEAIDYAENSVVIDNPPFSIVTKITRFYLARGIRFFLFAPHLTLFSSDLDCTHIVVGGTITYENGAVVKTSFLSNMLGNAKIVGDADIYKELQAINEGNKVGLPKYVYPTNVLTVSMVDSMVNKGISFRLNKGQTAHSRGLDSQKKHGKSLFGSGFLLSDSAAAEKAAAEKAAAEKAAAEKAAAERTNAIVWELSARERKIIENLD